MSDGSYDKDRVSAGYPPVWYQCGLVVVLAAVAAVRVRRVKRALAANAHSPFGAGHSAEQRP
jgi:hypothetical protein